MLHCADCRAPHDLDEHPDTGECIHCKGPLIQDGEERPDITRVLAEAITESLAERLSAVLPEGWMGREGEYFN